MSQPIVYNQKCLTRKRVEKAIYLEQSIRVHAPHFRETFDLRPVSIDKRGMIETTDGGRFERSDLHEVISEDNS